MLFSISETLNDLNEKFNNFINKQADNPFFWVAMFAILLAIGIYSISKLADK